MTSANKADKKVLPFPRPARRAKMETAFLPAALEVVETPPSPAGRAIGSVIILFFCIALGWASIGELDIVATAPGKIIPSGRTKVIQPFETGVVRAIHVRDGQTVNAGDLLIELDATMNAAELEHSRRDLLATQLDVARLRAALGGKDNPVDAFVAPAGATAEAIELQRQFLISQDAENKSTIAQIEQQLAQKQAERETIGAGIAKLEATAPLLQERVDIRKYLYGRELGSKLLYLSEQQDLVGQQKEVLVQKAKQKEAAAAIAGLEEARSKAIAEYRRSRFDELNKTEQKAAGLVQDIIKADQRTRFQLLTSPVDGIVQQLAVHTIGGVVTPAQSLAVVVPLESRLEIEAMVSNRDVGFISAGQRAEIKVDTFSFTRYGLLHGTVLSVSSDAITRDRPQDKNNDQARGSEAVSSEPRGQELGYAARVSLDRTQMQIENKLVNLTPGMAVTVEIKTGTRRIISYLLSPLRKYQHDVLRER